MLHHLTASSSTTDFCKSRLPHACDSSQAGQWSFLHITIQSFLKTPLTLERIEPSAGKSDWSERSEAGLDSPTAVCDAALESPAGFCDPCEFERRPQKVREFDRFCAAEGCPVGFRSGPWSQTKEQLSMTDSLAKEVKSSLRWVNQHCIYSQSLPLMRPSELPSQSFLVPPFVRLQRD